MKKSELQKIIREEVKRRLNEGPDNKIKKPLFEYFLKVAAQHLADGGNLKDYDLKDSKFQRKLSDIIENAFYDFEDKVLGKLFTGGGMHLARKSNK